jgi:integrase
MARGSIRELRPDVWQLRAYAGTDPATGEERRLSKTVHGSRRRAEDELVHLVLRATRIRDGGGTVSTARASAGVLTVREALEAWLTHARPGLEPNGADTDEDQLRNYVFPHLGDVELWRLRPNQLAAPGDTDHDPDLVSMTAFYAMLSERGTAGRRYRDGSVRGAGRPLGPAAIRRTHGTLRRGFDYCVTRNWIRANPVVGAKLPTISKRPATTPSAPALAAFLGFLEGDQPELVCFLDLMNSGARRVDMGVQWPEVSFGAEGGGAVLFGARGLIGHRGPDGRPTVTVRTTPTRKRRLRTVALDPVAAGRLLALRTGQETRAALCGVTLAPDAFVFPAPFALDGRAPRDPGWFSGAFRNAKKRAARAGVVGLAGVRPYDVRHFMITQMLAHGVAPAVVAERAGNSARTMDAFYRHAVPAQDQAAAELMARILRGAQ